MTLNNFLIMLFPAIVALSGGVLAAYWRPGHDTRSLIQHFAAGVVLAAVAVEVFPEIGREHVPGWAAAGSFVLGSLFMFALKLLAQWLEHREAANRVANATSSIAFGLIIATFIDVAVDGFIIGAGFAVGGQTGAILAFGLAVELLFLGLSLASESLAGWRIVALSGALGLDVLLFSLLGNFLLTGASHTVIGAALSFSAAALLYLVTEELLMEAHEVPEKPVSTLVLFGGFLSFWGIQLIGA